MIRTAAFNNKSAAFVLGSLMLLATSSAALADNDRCTSPCPAYADCKCPTAAAPTATKVKESALLKFVKTAPASKDNKIAPMPK